MRRICHITLAPPATAKKKKKARKVLAKSLSVVCLQLASAAFGHSLATFGNCGKSWRRFSHAKLFLLGRNYFKVLLLLINSIKRFINFYFLNSLGCNGKTFAVVGQKIFPALGLINGSKMGVAGYAECAYLHFGAAPAASAVCLLKDSRGLPLS